jgi:hypothetical protein
VFVKVFPQQKEERPTMTEANNPPKKSDDVNFDRLVEQFKELKSGRFRAFGVKARLPRNVLVRPGRSAASQLPGATRRDPDDLRALGDIHRWATTIEKLPKCLKCGGQPRVRNSEFCRYHGGAGLLLARMKSDPSWRPSKSQRPKTIIKQHIREGTFPARLLNEPIFVHALNLGYYGEKPPLHRTEGVRSRQDFFNARDTARQLVEDLVVAWGALDQHGDHDPWLGCIARGLALKYA